MKQYIVDAFTNKLFGGNPAAVIPCETMPSADLMLSLAIENNYSETAFVVKTGTGDINSNGSPQEGKLNSVVMPPWRHPSY